MKQHRTTLLALALLSCLCFRPTISVAFQSNDDSELKCDTILTMDHRRIIAVVQLQDRWGLLYQECGAESDSDKFLPKHKLQAIHAHNGVITVFRPAKTPKAFEPEVKAALNRMPRRIFWLGITRVNYYQYDDYGTPGGRFLLGLELCRPKSAGFSAAIFLHPDRYKYKDGTTYKTNWNNEYGFAIKKKRSKRPNSAFYVGAAIRFGQRTESYDVSSAVEVSKVNFVWERYFLCLEWRQTWKWLAFAVNLPVGRQHFHISKQVHKQVLYQVAKTWVWQPALTVGVAF